VDTEQMRVTVQPAVAAAASRAERAPSLPRPLAHLGAIIAGWREAWLTRHDNPLCAAWELADRRQVQFGQPKHRSLEARKAINWLTAIAVLTLGVLCAITCSEADLWSLDWMDFGPRDSSVELKLFLLSFIGLIPLAFVVSSVWFCQQFHRCLMICFQFLHVDRHPKTHFYDDLTAATPLSEQEVLLAFIQYCYRRLRLPLLLLTSSATAFGLVNVLPEIGDAFRGYADDFSPLLPWLLGAPLWLVNATAGCALYLLLALGLSRTSASGIWPQTGAFSLIAIQLLAWVFMSQAGGIGGDQWSLRTEYYHLAVLGSMLLALGTLLFLLARYSGVVRMGLTLGWPLVLGVLAITLGAVLQNAGLGLPDDYYYQGRATDTVAMHTLFAIDTLGVFPHSAATSAGLTREGMSSGETWRLLLRWLYLLPLRIILLLLAAEFARDAVRRRKWGAA
jgi:hypothetical protein